MIALVILPANIANPDGCIILPFAMCAYFTDRPSKFNAAITTNNEVISYAFPSLFLVAIINVGRMPVHIGLGICAMHDDFVNFSHWVVRLWLKQFF